MLKIINLQVKGTGVRLWRKKTINLLITKTIISAKVCRFIFQNMLLWVFPSLDDGNNSSIHCCLTRNIKAYFLGKKSPCRKRKAVMNPTWRLKK